MNRQKIIVILVIISTLLVAVGAIFIANKLNETKDTTPEDSEAEEPGIVCSYTLPGLCFCDVDPGNDVKCCSDALTAGGNCSGDDYSNSCQFASGIPLTSDKRGMMAYCDYSDPRNASGISWRLPPENVICDCSTNIPDGYQGPIPPENAGGCINVEGVQLVQYLSECSNGYPYMCQVCIQTNIDPLDTDSPTPTYTPSPTNTPTNTPGVSTTITITTDPSITITNTNTPTVTNSITNTPIASVSSTVITTRANITGSPSLPSTALIDDKIDLIIIGLTFITLGGLLYKTGLYIRLGQIYWEGPGQTISSGLNQTNKGITSIFDNIFSGIYHFDKTITYTIYQLKVRIKMGLVLLYNNILLVKEQIITLILKIISNILNIFLFLIIQFKKLIKTIKIVFKSILFNIKKLFRNNSKSSSFESKVIENSKEEIDE